MKTNNDHNVNDIIPISELSSGIIKEFNYNEKTKTLCVTVTDGFVYNYFGVPEALVAELRNSYNPGFFYRKYIRKKYRRLLKKYDLDAILST